MHGRITTARIRYFTRYLISPLSHYGWPAPILHKSDHPSNRGTTGRRRETDYLIMPDAVYARRGTKVPALAILLDLYCDASRPRQLRTTMSRSPRSCQTEKSSVAFFPDISGAAQLRVPVKLVCRDNGYNGRRDLEQFP